MQMKFDDYWDTRIEANPGPCKHNPGIMNFAYSEALHLYEHMMENLRQAELRAVKAEKELAALKAAAVPVVRWWESWRKMHPALEYGDIASAGGTIITAEHLHELARLCGGGVMAITTMELKRAMIEQQRTILELRARLTKTEKEHVQKDNIIQRLLRRETEAILRGQEWRFRAETAEARLAEVEAQRDKWKKEFEWLKSKVVFDSDSDGDVV